MHINRTANRVVIEAAAEVRNMFGIFLRDFFFGGLKKFVKKVC